MCSKNQDVSIKYVHKASFNVTSVIKNEIYQIRHVKLYLHVLLKLDVLYIDCWIIQICANSLEHQ